MSAASAIIEKTNSESAKIGRVIVDFSGFVSVEREFSRERLKKS
jgi:hypothetical protein